MLRIIIGYIVASRDFAPYQLGEMIHPNLVVKRFTLIFRHFVFSATSSKMFMHPSYTKIHIILSSCDNVIENTQIHMSERFFFFPLI